jgi:hypothetical protein
MRDRGRLEPVRRAELTQDVGDMDAGGPDADDQLRGDLTIRVATGDKGQDLGLASARADPVEAAGVATPLPPPCRAR